MKLHYWYVAKVKYSETNTEHRAIVQCYHEAADPIVYVIQSDGRPKLHVSEFHSFEIVSEIEEMNAWKKKNDLDGGKKMIWMEEKK